MQTLDAAPYIPPRPTTTMTAKHPGGLGLGSGSQADLSRAPSQQLLHHTTLGATRLSNPQFTSMNMAPYNRPQTSAFGYRNHIGGGSSLPRDPSKKVIRASEEVTSITGLRTMTALAPTV